MTSPSTPEGPGSVCGAPNLPAGFTGTFASRYVDTGELRLHAVTGGDGPPLLLVHGWPQTWYQFRLIMPGLARDFSVVAVDQRGIGLSDKPPGGYDTATLASDLVKLMDALGHPRFALYGTDVGMPIAYALAADHRDRVDRLVVSEAPSRAYLPRRRCSCRRRSTPCSGTWPSTSSPRSMNSSSPGGKELVADRSQGVQLATIQASAPASATRWRSRRRTGWRAFTRRAARSSPSRWHGARRGR
jgi:pimeloyl-ACP methyl ester carboxylesterase